jgi:hypothetical protein
MWSFSGSCSPLRRSSGATAEQIHRPRPPLRVRGYAPSVEGVNHSRQLGGELRDVFSPPGCQDRVKQQEEREPVSRCHVETHEGRGQNEQGDARLRQLQQIGDAILAIVEVYRSIGFYCNLPLSEAWAEVHAANMRKEPGTTKRGFGRDAIKPPGWCPPNLAAVVHGVRHVAA